MPKSTNPAYQALVATAIDDASEELVAISRDIHSHPELNFQEHHAAQVLADSLAGHGFDVEREVGGVETAFRAVAHGSGDGPSIGILVEYDALPDVGHGCGHNLLAISTLGGGIGAKAALGELPGRIVVVGTPAEEGGGGKIRLLEAGIFDDIDISLSSHPAADKTIVRTDWPLDASLSLAMVGYRYIFRGKAAHAASKPYEGVNALNALIHLFTGIDAMRQHLREDVRIHGIISDGGGAPNVVPDFAAANFMLRSREKDYLHDVVVERVASIAQGAAAMTGATVEIEPFYPLYDNVRPNVILAKATGDHAAHYGLRLDEPESDARGAGGSTDFGNVSQVVPSFAMTFAISEVPIPGHSIEMAAAAITDLGHGNALLCAKAIGATACELLQDPSLVARARAEFDQRGEALA